MSSNRSYLVIVGEGIGNMVETTPLISVLARFGKVFLWAKPQTPGTDEILMNPVYVDSIFPFDGAGKANPRTWEWDRVFQTFSTNVNKDPRFNEFDNLVTFEEEDVIRAKVYGEAMSNLYQAEKAGLIGKGKPRVWPRSFVNCEKPIMRADVVLHSGALHESKRWPHFKKLMSELSKRNLEVIDLAGAGEFHYTLPEVAATIRDALLYIGNDSGVSHISSAVRTTTLIIYGPTSINKNLPYGSKSIPIQTEAMDCRPCIYQNMVSKCRYECLSKVSVDMVLAKAFENLQFLEYRAGRS